VRVAVLPRELAARVISTGMARAVWAINVANLVLAIPLLLEYSYSAQVTKAAIGPLAILLALAVLAGVGVMVPRPWVVAVFLVLGAAGAIAYEVVLISADPGVATQALFMLNRPAVSLVLVGVAATDALVGTMYTVIGFLTSMVVSAFVAILTATPYRAGLGPILCLITYVTSFVVLASIQAGRRRRVPNLEALELETRRLALEENLQAKVGAAIHDTLLNDISFVMNSPDVLDERMLNRLRADLATLADASWLRADSPPTDAIEQDVGLRNEIMKLISDVQWRGLTVKVTGMGAGIYRLAPDAPAALLGAIAACLENALHHSGASVAEVNLVYEGDSVTVMVTDEGRGFDPDAVGLDRLGLRRSVIDRIESVGGDVRIWSTPGEGTSVVMRLPVVEVVRQHERSDHGAS
jgi:signal transduction histidine kinase